MKIVAYLGFDGNCAEAFKFYEQVLGGQIQAMLTHGEVPSAEHVPAEMHNRVMHACLAVGDALVMGGDVPAPGMYQTPNGMCASIHTQSPDEAHRIFAGLSEGGEVQMPIQETFWSPAFGMLRDRFGTPWLVNCEPAG